MSPTPSFIHVVLVRILGATDAVILPSPRITLAMARDGLSFERAATVHARFGTPADVILMHGAVSAFFVL
ncbi:MAG: hypothetical protein ACYDCK_13855 [Thermoplasmatota archaeon]